MTQIITSDVLILKVNCLDQDKEINVECFCYFSVFENQYFICSGSKNKANKTETYEYFCKKKDSLLTMLNAILCGKKNIEMSLFNCPNLFFNNDCFDYRSLSEKYKIHENELHPGESSLSIISKLNCDYYFQDEHAKLKSYIKLLKSVRHASRSSL
jgi:hypothetical protein